MNKTRPTGGERASSLAAAVASIVLTFLTLLRAVFSVHADQTAWAATAPTTTTAGPAEESARDHGGASAWV